MVSVNKVILIGNLTKDPELRYTPQGQAVARFRVAVNRKYKDRSTGELKDLTDFIPVVVWREQAENATKYLSKGRLVYVEGRLRLSTWNTPEGQQRSRLEVVAQRVQFLPRASAPGTTLGTAPVEPEGVSQDESDNTEAENSSKEDVPF